MAIKKTVNGREMIWDDDELDWKEVEPPKLLAPPMQPYLFLVEPLDYEIKETDLVALDIEAPQEFQTFPETGAIRIDWAETVRDLFKPNTVKGSVPRSGSRGSLWPPSWFGGDAA